MLEADREFPLGQVQGRRLRNQKTKSIQPHLFHRSLRSKTEPSGLLIVGFLFQPSLSPHESVGVLELMGSWNLIVRSLDQAEMPRSEHAFLGYLKIQVSYPGSTRGLGQLRDRY
jgi:hypothetical protein